jgi:hypothetical protein
MIMTPAYPFATCMSVRLVRSEGSASTVKSGLTTLDIEAADAVGRLRITPLGNAEIGQLHPWGRVHPRQACRRRSTLLTYFTEAPWAWRAAKRDSLGSEAGLLSALRGMMRGLAGTSCGA